jgi:hypothetical protein
VPKGLASTLIGAKTLQGGEFDGVLQSPLDRARLGRKQIGGEFESSQRRHRLPASANPYSPEI